MWAQWQNINEALSMVVAGEGEGRKEKVRRRERREKGEGSTFLASMTSQGKPLTICSPGYLSRYFRM